MAEETKVCTKCGEDKKLSEYYVHKSRGIRSSCKKCDNAMSRRYKANNRKHISKYNKKYKAVHRDEISVYNHDYNKENREAIQKRQTAQHRERRKTDANYKLACLLRSELYQYIKNGKMKEKMGELTGCDVDFLTSWLSFQFFGEMTDENYGSVWCIDHVIPVSSYNLLDDIELKECYHWTNLRPCILMDNSTKTNKLNKKLIIRQEKLVKKFIKFIEDENFGFHYTLLDDESDGEVLNDQNEIVEI